MSGTGWLLVLFVVLAACVWHWVGLLFGDDDA